MNTPFLYKRCTTCGEWKIANTDNFGKIKKGKFGLKARCKICDKEYNKQYKENNKDKIKEYSKQYREDNKEYYKEYYKNNKNKIKESKEKYYKNNKDKIKEYHKKYYKSPNGIVHRLNSHNKRREKKFRQGKGITKEQWLEMMKFFDWKCAYSGETLSIKTRSIDHIIAINQDGMHEIWNVVPMYKSHNSSKSSRKAVLNWYKEQEYFSEERLAKIVEWQQYAYDKWATEDDELILIKD